MSGKPRAGTAATDYVAARLTPAESAALEKLQHLRAADLANRSEPPDASFSGWLRWVIRKEAKAADIEVDVRRVEPAPALAPMRGRKSPYQ